MQKIPGGLSKYCPDLSYLLLLFPGKLNDDEQPAIEELSEVKTMLAERVKEWNRESLEKGIQEGMQKGKVESLTTQLQIKFGKLPENVVEKCRDASEEQLRQWSAHILTAKTMGDVFGN